jgi:hypothetical protein
MYYYYENRYGQWKCEDTGYDSGDEELIREDMELKAERHYQIKWDSEESLSGVIIEKGIGIIPDFEVPFKFVLESS